MLRLHLIAIAQKTLLLFSVYLRIRLISYNLLDISCFAVLKRQYGQAVKIVMRTSINHINKTEFLTSYQSARERTLLTKTIRSGFTTTGLVLFDPNRVLEQLHVLMRMPTPPSLPIHTSLEQS